MSVLVKMESVSKSFGGVQALSDIDLEIMTGEVLSIIGPNGAGKTTLFNVLTGFDPPTNGKILFEGLDVTGKPVATMCKAGMARTFQNIRLFAAMTVIDNLVVGMHTKVHESLFGILFRYPTFQRSESAAYRKALDILDYLGLRDAAYEYAGNLPYGKQRKVEIGRALASEPKLILLDEPAAGMNPQESMDLMSLIRGILKLGPAVVLIEHNVRLVMGISDRVTVLDFGKKIADCSPSECQSNAKVIEAYLGKEESE